MSEHLSATLLSGLADGELSTQEMNTVKEHLDRCPVCTSDALSQAMLKTAVAKAGQRYSIPTQLERKMKRIVAREPEEMILGGEVSAVGSNWLRVTGLVAAAVLLAVLAAPVYLRFGLGWRAPAKEQTALVSEVSDLHVAALAANQAPQVLSSDRHTVKPWFQGKIPFSFNLPEELPPGTQLDGANLVYLHEQPVAQLMYRVGPHRVSIFVRQRGPSAGWNALPQEHAGFQIAGFETAELDVIAISDVDRARLLALVDAIEQVQTGVSSTGQAHP